jgi:hypothetical protein
MTQTIGEAREEWGLKVWQMVEDFAENMKKEQKPFYIVYAAKPDTTYKGCFRQAIKAYYHKPPKLLGILVWYVDNAKGIFEFSSKLSAPPDIPVDPELLSEKPQDASERVMEQGERLNVLLS